MRLSPDCERLRNMRVNTLHGKCNGIGNKNRILPLQVHKVLARYWTETTRWTAKHAYYVQTLEHGQKCSIIPSVWQRYSATAQQSFFIVSIDMWAGLRLVSCGGRVLLSAIYAVWCEGPSHKLRAAESYQKVWYLVRCNLITEKQCLWYVWVAASFHIGLALATLNFNLYLRWQTSFHFLIPAVRQVSA